jgi:hypothetical protein
LNKEGENGVKHVKENIGSIWLGDLSNYTIGLKFRYYTICKSFGDAAGKNDSNFGVHAMQCARKLKSVQVWHHVIRQDKADGCAILVIETFCLNSIRRDQNSVAVSGEDPFSNVADVFFIIHNKDGLAVSPWQIGSFGVDTASAASGVAGRKTSKAVP